MIQLQSLDTLKDQLKKQKYSQAFLDDPAFSSGLNALMISGLPTPRNEEWKYFPLSKVLDHQYSLGNETHGEYHPSNFQPYLSNANHILIINGQYVHSTDIMNVKGLSIKQKQIPIAHIDTDPKANPFPLLNALLRKDHISVSIDAEYDSSRPIHVLHIIEHSLDTPILASPSISVTIESNAKAHIIESYHLINVNQGLINTSFTVDAETHSELHHIIIQDGLKDCMLLYNCESVLKAEAKVQDHVIVHDSHSVRNTITGKLTEENGLYNIYGIVSGDKQALIDNHTVVDHIAPHCESNELFKHVLDDASTAVFNGKIFVRLDAQKTNAYQSNRTLLLSPKATINTKPQLEIFADDVKCSHGATTGSVDEESLYYLQARGIPRDAAMRLLTEAFIGEVIQLIDIEELKAYFSGTVLMNAGA